MSEPESHAAESMDAEAVAVVGMAGRFPGAADVRELWRNLAAGVESISFFSREELAASGVPPDVLDQPHHVPAKGVLEDPELFDAAFFGLTAREAEVMDPQNRIFLECCWSAAEDAGYDIRAYGGRAGIYAGASMSSYLLSNLMSRPDVLEKVGALQVRISNEKDALATWVAYKLDLNGPCVTVQTACSTSLVSVHFACQGLLDGECDLALAGGVSVTFPKKSGYFFQAGGILSPDGRCRSFDAAAQGAVPGNGAGVVVLKRLSDALEDRDTIRAVIRGTAVSNDGALRAGYAAPGVEGQMRVVAEALSLAEVAPETVGYVECHGSGTALGDPIEIEALTRAFRRGTDKLGFCAVGSAKASLGHLDAAAGVTGLIKTVCALEAGQLPPSPHFETPNPAIDFASSPFYVNKEPRDWPPPEGMPRRAGVSSFGIGGTNAHAVLEEAPPRRGGAASRPWQQLVLSARTAPALEAARVRLLAYLKTPQGHAADLADVAYTLRAGRADFAHRLALVCRDRDDAVAVLEANEPRRLLESQVTPGGKDPGVAFLFPGLGDHHPGMGLELYRREVRFRQAVDECCEILEPLLGVDPRQVLYPDGTDTAAPDGAPGTATPDLRRLTGRGATPASDAERRLDRTLVAQPAVFVVEYALARLLREWGLAPRALIGYSLGEYVAACLAGVFTLSDALAIVATRARMIDQLPTGSMLAVPLPEAEVTGRLESDDLSLSAANGASLSVVGGPPEAVASLAERLGADGVACQTLRTTHAFHSSMMEPIRDRFVEEMGRFRLRPPRIPFLSNVTGERIRDEEATDPAYWGRHLVETVRFSAGLGELLADDSLRLLEVGPGQALTTLARQHEARNDVAAFPTLPDRHEGVSAQASVLTAVNRLWLAGVAADGAGFYRGEQRRRLPLPTYPFERRRFWVEPGGAMPAAARREEATVAREADLADWFYLAGWKRAAPVDRGTAGAADRPWLLFLGRDGAGALLAERLRAAGQPVATATAGVDFAELEDGAWTLDPCRRHHYSALLEALAERDAAPAKIVHLWNLAPGAEDWNVQLDLGFYSLLFLAQALGRHQLAAPIEIAVVSSEMQEVTGTEDLCPAKATLLGPCRVISQEYPQLSCRSIDLEAGAAAESQAAALMTELGGGFDQPVVAWRGRHRWLRTIEPTRVEPAGRTPVRRGGAYLVTGVDESALVIAEHLAATAEARLAMLAPPDFPDRAGWDRRLLKLEETAGDLVIESADVSDPEAVATAVRRVRERYGELHGLVHTETVEGGGVIQLKSPDNARPVLAPKVAGTLALAAAVRGLDLDFFVVYSATVALTGGIGQVDSCAANAFVDAFARSRAASRTSTIAIGWDPFRWQPIHPSLPPELVRQLEHNLESFGIGSEDCREVFDRLLATRLPHAWVSARPLSRIVRELTEKPDAGMLGELGEGSRDAHSRPELATPYRAPCGETEEVLAGLWQDAIGTDRVGVDDNFFELDGNSLVALQIATRVRPVLGVELPLALLFEAPTVAELAARIDELRREAEELLETEALLAEVESLTPEEAELLLAREGSAA